MAYPSANPGPAHVAESRQKRAGEAIRERSRLRLVQGAAEVFAECGYAGATVNAIAERSGVSLRTLYTSWGSKRRLLRAYVELTMTGSPTAVTDGSWVPQARGLIDPEALADPQLRLRGIARQFRVIAERMDLPWRLLRDGAAVDDEVARDRAELEELRRRTMSGVLQGLDERALRPGLSLESAIDTLYVLASPASYDTLVRSRGYSLDQFENWLADSLVAALLR